MKADEMIDALVRRKLETQKRDHRSIGRINALLLRPEGSCAGRARPFREMTEPMPPMLRVPAQTKRKELEKAEPGKTRPISP